MEPKLATFRIDVSRETGHVALLIKTECGMRPVMSWPNINGMEDFAVSLLEICSQVQQKTNYPLNTSEQRKN